MQRQTIETTYLVTLVEKIKQWHYDRNLIDGANDKDQVCKLIQEVGELSDNVCKGRDVSDDIGDIVVVLINIAERNKLSLTECLQQAYNDIADRKGKMVDGIFIKEEPSVTFTGYDESESIFIDENVIKLTAESEDDFDYSTCEADSFVITEDTITVKFDDEIEEK
jgi:hypothetical protein